jgi:cholesterol transport system auxiliary component
MKTRMTGLLILGLLILVVSSCSILPESQPSAVHDFGYPYSNLSSDYTTLTQQSSVTVEAPKWLADNRIRYRLLYATPTQVRFYTMDRWIAPPPELFEQLLTASGKQRPKPVTIQVQVFEQQFDTPDKAKVIMNFTANTTLADNNKDKATKRDFHLQLPCPTPDAKGAVTGFNILTRQAVDKVQAWFMEAN